MLMLESCRLNFKCAIVREGHRRLVQRVLLCCLTLLEWAERSGGTLNASSATWADVAAMKELDADAIVFPSRYLGELCTRDWLRPVRSSVLDSPEFNAADIFPLLRHTVMKW